MSEGLAQIDELKTRLAAEVEPLNSLALDGLTLADAETKLREVGDIKVRLTGKKSDLAALKKQIGTVAPEDRAAFAQAVQVLEKDVATAIESAEAGLKAKLTDLRTESERLDVTIPGRRPRTGHLHPITLLRQRIEDIFVSMGYAIEDDREIETDYYNFDTLNIPENHPARESQDTFYTTTGLALRSQTSTVQIRAMERRGVPLHILAPGKVFRRDTPDMTHTPMFHQLEGLCVDKGITMAHLKGTVTEWLRRMYGPGTVTRFRPSYFPFTEPSAEFDFSCFKCGGTGRVSETHEEAHRIIDSVTFQGEPLTFHGEALTFSRCRPCKGSGWIELGGSGMVHPNVLRAVGVDPTVYSGFAFGFGLERMTALMYSIDDIRHMFENDVRFLEQFA